MHMSLGELQKLVMDREAWPAEFMGSQRIGHDWVTELNWIDIYDIDIDTYIDIDVGGIDIDINDTDRDDIDRNDRDKDNLEIELYTHSLLALFL